MHHVRAGWVLWGWAGPWFRHQDLVWGFCPTPLGEVMTIEAVSADHERETESPMPFVCTP